MNYAEQASDPRKRLTGLVVVVGFHVILVYALVNGLARKVVDVLKVPLTVSVLEEIKTAPPPPPKSLPPPPKVAAPPPPDFVPPVEVAVQAPPQNVIVATSSVPAPEPAPVVAAPVAAPVVNVAVACPNSDAVRAGVPYPPEAERMNLAGNVLVEFTVGPTGEVRDVASVRSSNPVFIDVATKAVTKFRCNGQGHDVHVKVPFAFRPG